MATTEEITQQFQYAFNAKEDIKDAINEKGVEVTDSTPLGEYGNRVRQINQNLSPFDYSTGTDSAIQKSQDPNDANVADGYHAGAFGTSNSAPEDNSFAIGNGLTTGADNQTVVGQHNEVSNDSLFVVGNGVDAQNKSNAFEVKADGTAIIGANPSSPMGVATKEYVDTGLSEKANPDGYYKEMTVGYSEQLLSTTGVETNDAFITRTTAGEADVTSGPAQIRKIKGNTINWNQLVENGDFASDSGWTVNNPNKLSFSVSDNTLTATIVGDIAGPGSVYRELTSAIIGHKYLVRYTISATVGNAHAGYGYGGIITPGSISAGLVAKTVSALFEATSTLKEFYLYFSGNVNTTYTVKNTMLFDLTQMFGEGKEPTLDEFNAMYNDNYYPYNAGELVSCKPSGMQTVGFNLCSCASIFERTIETSPFPTYTLSASERETVKAWLKELQRYHKPLKWEITATPYEDTGTALGFGGIYLQPYGTIISPRASSFSLDDLDIDGITNIIIYGVIGESTLPSTTLSNACMHFVWSGSRNGDYEPYKQNTLAVNTATYFPNGMRSAGAAYDEMDFEGHKAITRIDSVDLGGLTWAYSSATKFFYANNTIAKQPVDSTTLPNIICPIYTTRIYDSVANINADDMGICISPEVTTSYNRIAIKNKAYDSYEDVEQAAADFTTAMSGVYAYYEVVTPTEVPIPEYTSNIYRADDYGTETWLQTGNPDPAAPVDSELFYYANLRDKLQHLPDLASTDGSYLIKQTGTQMELIAGYSKAEIDAIVGNIDTALTTILYGTGGNE